jgi:hypothetical protein
MSSTSDPLHNEGPSQPSGAGFRRQEVARYLAFLHRRRNAVEAMTTGLRDYLSAELDEQIYGIENEQSPDSDQIVTRLTEDLMAATTDVQMIESQVQQLQDMFSSLDPGTAAAIQPFMPIINGLLRPMMEQMWMKAKRKRDDIQAELMEHEDTEATEQLSRHPDSATATDSTGGLS